jgi:hypothetical protein
LIRTDRAEMSDHKPREEKALRSWEIFFSLHISLAAVTTALIAFEPVMDRMAHVEMSINQLLHIRQTDFVRGHLATWIPTVLVASSLWVFLRWFSRTHAVRVFLRSLAGILTLLTPPVFWVSVHEINSWPFDWLSYIALFETAVVLICTLLFLRGRWKAPLLAIFFVSGIHYVLWYEAGASNLLITHYGGPIGTILGFCAAVSWAVYVNGLRRADAAP